MRCEECSKYEKCAEDGRLKDNCCLHCPEYFDCVGIDSREKRSFKDSYRNNNYEDYF